MASLKEVKTRINSVTTLIIAGKYLIVKGFLSFSKSFYPSFTFLIEIMPEIRYNFHM